MSMEGIGIRYRYALLLQKVSGGGGSNLCDGSGICIGGVDGGS